MIDELLEKIEKQLDFIYSYESMIMGKKFKDEGLIKHIKSEWSSELCGLQFLCEENGIDYKVYYEPLREESERYSIKNEKDIQDDIKHNVESLICDYNVFNNTIKNLENSEQYNFKCKILNDKRQKALRKLIEYCNEVDLNYKEYIEDPHNNLMNEEKSYIKNKVVEIETFQKCIENMIKGNIDASDEQYKSVKDEEFKQRNALCYFCYQRGLDYKEYSKED